MRTVRSLVTGLFFMLIASTGWAAACDGFTDVDSANSTYCPAVTYLKDRGITLGCTGTTYCPNDPVTRLQMALFLQRAAQGGSSNTLGSSTNFIGGGANNDTSTNGHTYSAIAGGTNNATTGDNSFVGSGHDNTAGPFSFVGAGQSNTASGLRAVVAGGNMNTATAADSAVIAGDTNTASGINSVVLGGQNNTAGGAYSTVLGFRAKTTVAGFGSFVFADTTGFDVTSTAANEFIVAASGGIRMLSDKSGTVGCSLAGGGGTWACSSSRDVKREFEEVDRQQVLDRVLALPVQTWRYKNEASDIRHMGTFAQDFRAAFGLGSDDTTISVADADGVALAAIQGLNAKVEARDALIAQQARELSALSTRLAAFADVLRQVEASLR